MLSEHATMQCTQLYVLTYFATAAAYGFQILIASVIGVDLKK